jgi:hypothetical protein
VAYVSLQDSDELLAIDLATQAPRWKIKVGKLPADIYLTADDRTLLVGLTGDRVVEAYDVSGAAAGAGQAHPHRRRRARLPLQGRQAPCVRQQPRGQHHQPDRHADAGGGGRTARPGRPRRHGPAGRRPHAAAGSRWARKLSFIDIAEQARWCGRSTSAARRTACGRWTMRRASSALLALAAAGRWRAPQARPATSRCT